MFSNKIKQLCEKLEMLQRQLATALGIDMPMYCKIERVERPTKRKQIPIFANLLKTNENALVVLWLADKINTSIGDENELALQALKIVRQKKE